MEGECRVTGCPTPTRNQWRPFCDYHWKRLTPELRHLVTELVTARQQGTEEFEDLVTECNEVAGTKRRKSDAR